jgi:hypothetical protein
VTLFWILLITIGPFLVAAPEFFTGRRTRRPRSHWAIA